MVGTPPVVLTIAGFDPSSGAGITADIKTIAAHNCYGISCITTLTVQSTAGVKRVQSVDPQLIADTLRELVSDLTIAAIHIGMMGNAKIVTVVADFLEEARLPHVVLDPVLKSSSGTDLLDSSSTKLLIERMIPLVEVITPNLEEASVLTGVGVADLKQMHAAALRLHALGAANVVVTGGHLVKAIDLLSVHTDEGAKQELFEAERQRSNSTHGTGCAFATALACHLAHGRGLSESVRLSKCYVSDAIAEAYPVGRGIGPLNHLYRLG
jgi:hydroxymethylpyrimidine/phosphomethylpyrimidine kinase